MATWTLKSSAEWLFSKMALKVKNKTPVSPEAEAKAKKAELKGIHSHKKRRHAYHPSSEGPRHCAPKATQTFLEERPQEHQA